MTFRYSKLKIFYDFLALVVDNLFVIFILFILNPSSDSPFMYTVKWIAIAFLLLGLFGRLKETFFTKVVFEEEGVHIYTGIFSKSEQFIPREKFENVQTNAKVLHRLFGVREITLETGEATSEVSLKFVSKSFIKKMEDYVLHKHSKDFEQLKKDEQRNILFTPSIRDILKAALLSFSFLAVIPIGIDLWSDLKPNKYINISRFDFDFPIWAIVIFAFLGIILVIGIGVLKTFNSYYQYEISTDAERIYVRKGWLSKQTFSIRKAKVQAVVFEQSLYQKLLKVTTIKLVSTGEILASDDQQINEFFPYLPTDKADKLVAEMLPEFARKQMSHRASAKAKWLIALRPPLFAISLFIVGYWVKFFLLIGAVVLVLTYISRILTYRQTAFEFNEKHLQIRAGGFTEETVVTNRAKLLEIKYEQSLLQRAVGVISFKTTNRAQPILVTTVLDIDPSIKQDLTTWFEERIEDVKLDLNSKDGALKAEAVRLLLRALKLKTR